MSAWDEVVSFVKGTRPRPPPAPGSPRAAMLLVAASLVHMPLVYLLVREVALTPPFTLAVGLLAIGLAWSGGCALEGRRRGTVLLFAALGVAVGSLAFVPVMESALGYSRFLFALVAVASAGALALLLRSH